MAESFGSDPDRYQRSRPHYPQAMVERILSAAPGMRVLDVGIGTGIVARQFRDAGGQVYGVDVDERMGAFARADGFEVDVAKFEHWDTSGRTFDVVVAGQTWHWVDPLAGAAKAADVLVPEGRLAIFRSDGQPPPGLAATFGEIYARLMPQLPFNPFGERALSAQARLGDRAAAGIRESGRYDEPERWTFDWTHTYTCTEWLDQLPTHGGHGRLTPASQRELLDRVGAAIDATDGVLPMAYSTIVTTARRVA